MCRVLGLSPSGYYDWLRRPPSARARRDAELKGRILAKWIESGETYGCPRIHAALLAEGERVSRKRVARLMRELGIEGVTRRRFKTGTTRKDAKAKPAPDLVEPQLLGRGAPDQLWVADITYVPTWAGWLYLAVVLDTWSRRIVGWAMAPQMPADLVGDALTMAISCRQPKGPVIHHSDSDQYTSLAFGERCRKAGIVQSMGSVGDAYDNAMCESFFPTLECELIDRQRFRTAAEARREVFRFIEDFYNTRRLHSALGYESPTNFEKHNHAA